MSSTEEYYLTHISNEPSCKMCGGKVTFVNALEGYRTYCSSACGSRDPLRVVKTHATKLRKYGSIGFNNRDKAKRTLLETYGVENVSQLQEIKDKKAEKGYWFSRIDMTGENHPSRGRKHSAESLKKMRLSRIAEIESKCGQIMPNYNPGSISMLEAKARELGITDLQHAENGGEFRIKELGYWVDGYSKEKNIVIEYYETFHKKQVERDTRRKQEIIDLLGCEFIEIDE